MLDLVKIKNLKTLLKSLPGDVVLVDFLLTLKIF